MKKIKLKCLRDFKSGKAIKIPAPRNKQEREQYKEIRRKARNSAKRLLAALKSPSNCSL